MLKKKEGIEKDKVAVQLSSCITKDNFHAPPCPHIDYIKELLNKIGIDFYEDTRISDCSEKRRQQGIYRS
jgi:predicted metal-binding protein